MRFGFTPIRGSNPRASAAHKPLPERPGRGLRSPYGCWLRFGLQLPSRIAPERRALALVGPAKRTPGRTAARRQIDADSIGHHTSVLTEQLLAAWCRRHLGAAPGRVLFRRQHLSEVIAVELTDKRRVVVKARPFDQRIAGCVAVQAALAQAGFPCPAPLAGPVEVNDLAVNAEDLIPADENGTPANRAEPFAALLAWLIGTAPVVTAVPSLIPSPPWTGWDHPGSGVWPDRDDDGRNLNEVTGPAWVDETARLVRRQMCTCEAPDRIGHGDWESQNIQWQDGEVRGVHDWDSVIAQPEVAVVGLAAAVWPAAGGPGEAASIVQTADFLDAYQVAAGATWSIREVQLAWTAGLWVRLFNAKKDAAQGGGPQLDRLATEIRQRLARAGLHTEDWRGPRPGMAR
jgi:Phosphotransferase enzyme family